MLRADMDSDHCYNTLECMYVGVRVCTLVYASLHWSMCLYVSVRVCTCIYVRLYVYIRGCTSVYVVVIPSGTRVFLVRILVCNLA